MNRRLFYWIFIFLLFVVSLLQIITNLVRIVHYRPLLDLLVYYEAAGAFLNGKNPYLFSYSKPYDTIPFNYPPGSLIFFSFLRLIPFSLLQYIYTTVSLVSFFLSMWLISRIVNMHISLDRFLIISSLLLQTFPVKLTLVLGQINLIVLFIILLSFYLHKKHHFVSSSFLLAVASSIKLSPLGLLVIFLLKKEYRYIAITCILFFVFNVFQPRLFASYFFHVFPQLSVATSPQSTYDQSLTALFMRLFPSPISRMFSLLTVIILCICILIVKRKQMHEAFFSLLALLSIAGPFSWQHHLVFAYPFVVAFFTQHFLLFGTIWILLVFHFRTGNSIGITPLAASYQTILVFTLIIIEICRSWRKNLPKKEKNGFGNFDH